jgi:Tol biopolymer transport system component
MPEFVLNGPAYVAGSKAARVCLSAAGIDPLSFAVFRRFPMKTRFFVPFFLLIFLSLPAAPVSKRLVVGDAVIESQITDGLLAGTTTRVSVASDGTQGNGSSGWSAISGMSAISADGRYVAFSSAASNLVPGDTNGRHDVFVHDRQTGQTSRVSVASNGTQGNHDSGYPSISADGRYVAFHSEASNLVASDTNGAADIFVHDRQTGQTSRVSVASNGTQGNDSSWTPSISADGRYVALASYASNLVPGDTNGAADVFVHDRHMGQTSRISAAADGTQGNHGSGSPSISADGRYMAFASEASNLVAGDTNGAADIFVHDWQTGQTSRVSVASDGAQGNGASYWPSISADGRYAAFASTASNLVAGDTNSMWDIFVHDRQTGQTSRVSVASNGTQGNWHSMRQSISADGRYVAFDSLANNLVPGDTNGAWDVFVHDRQTGQTSRISVASNGTQGNHDSGYPSISADGRYVALGSLADNLVAGDTNGAADVFVHERDSLPPSLIANYPDGQPGSFFTLTGSDFPPNDAATVVINGVILTQALMIDSSGSITFLLDTSQADPGSYFVTLTVNSTATTGFILDPSAPLRPQEGSGTILDVPGGIAFTRFVYLAVVRR